MRKSFVLMLLYGLVLQGCTSLESNRSDKDMATISGACGAVEKAEGLAVAHCRSFNKQAIPWKIINKLQEYGSFGCDYHYRCMSAGDNIKEQETRAENANAQKLEEDRQQEIIQEKEREEKKKIELQDNTICRSYGLKKGTKAFAECRIKINDSRLQKEVLVRLEASRAAEQAAIQRYNAQLLQQQSAAQEQAARSAAWQNVWGSVSNYANQQQQIQNQQQQMLLNSMPRTTNCQRTYNGGMSCTTW